jgi:hypothetical protein
MAWYLHSPYSSESQIFGVFVVHTEGGIYLISQDHLSGNSDTEVIRRTPHLQVFSSYFSQGRNSYLETYPYCVFWWTQGYILLNMTERAENIVHSYQSTYTTYARSWVWSLSTHTHTKLLIFLQVSNFCIDPKLIEVFSWRW